MARTPPNQAKHRKIYSELASQIAAGRWGVDERLPTEEELVRRYGVSRTTVGRAMLELTRDGVIERRRGAGTYVASKPPKQGAGTIVSLFVPFLSPSQPLQHVEGQMRHFVIECAARAGLVPRLQPLAGVDHTPIAERFALAVEQVIESGARAVLYYPAELPPDLAWLNKMAVERLADAGLDVVLVDRDIVLPPERSRFLRVGFDNFRSSARLVAHMIEQGCQRLAFVGLSSESSSAQERLEGFRVGIEQHGGPGLAWQVWRVERPTEQLVSQIVREFRPDGIVCKSDLFAAEVSKILHSVHRMEIGRDVLLAGFDDDPVAAVLPVPLTTVRLDAHAFADAAVHCVTARLNHAMPQRLQVLVDCEILVRASSDRSLTPRRIGGGS